MLLKLTVLAALFASTHARALAELSKRTPSGWTYIGCAQDQASPRLLPYSAPDSSANSAEYCTAACASAGYSIAGMEYGNECWCGNSYGFTLDILTNGACNTACAGNSAELCGGTYALNVWQSSGSATTTTTTSAPTGTAVAKNSKRGICFAESDGDDIAVIDGTNTSITWMYNWAQTEPSYLVGNPLQWFPMQWNAAGASSLASVMSENGYKTILGFNEPDNGGQANMSPASAAATWIEYIQPLRSQGITLGAPAVTNGGPPSGAVWLQQFFGNCTGCVIDFIPFHWYGSGVSSFESYVENFHAEFPSYPLWITEFADTDSETSIVQNFMSETIQWLDTQSYVERYSWFGFFRNTSSSVSYYSLLDENGKLNSLGELYASGI